MLSSLQPPLSRYFEATNAHDAEAVAALFADDAVVHDEKADYRGAAAIKAWAQRTYDDYDLRVSPEVLTEDGRETVVRTRVAGRFVSSPIDLRLRFLTDGDRIKKLTIG